MPLHTNKRNFPYPAKTESFESSWGTFQEFFNTLDREFGSIFDFLIGTGIKYVWLNVSEQDDQAGMEAGDFAIRLDTGAVYEFKFDAWTYKYDVNSLPLNTDRDPSGDDWGHPIGFNWVNNKSGESFYCLRNEIGKTIWVSEQKAIGHEVRVGYFIRPANFEFQGMYIRGQIEKDGKFYYTNGETLVKLLFGAKEVGNIKIDPTKKYYGISDLDIMDYPVGHELFGTCNKDLFTRYLTLMNSICENPSPFYWDTKKVALSATVLEIISSDTSLNAELSRLYLPIPTTAEKIDFGYDFFHYITSLTQVNNTRKKELLQCMSCSGLVSFDGNITMIDGNIVFVDGNTAPPCA